MEIIKNKLSLADFVKSNYKELLELINCINVGIYITDGKGNTLLVNDESTKTGGLSREELIGKNMTQLLKEGYVTESASLKAIASGVAENIVQELGDGGQVFITGTPFIKNGQTEIVLCTERDITETIRLKEILEEKDRINKKYETELKFLRSQNAHIEKGVIAHSRIMNNIITMALRIAKWEITVLITGESGTGKEVLANYIYQNSNRNGEPFIKVNCSAIPENLVESEFFGYDKGSFTGAKNEGKLGLFELANRGTLFLDEIGELPLQMQSKLLRVIQEKEIMHIGGKKAIPIDVRLIAATNLNLKKAIAEGKFREDLYYRLNVVPIEIPPLRSRKEDVEELSLNFMEQFNKKYKQNKILTKDALQALMIYDWPGNIRELRNIIERIIITTDGDKITEIQINNQIYKDGPSTDLENNNEIISLQEQIEKFEKNLISKLLIQCKTAAEVSRILKVNRSTISKKIKKYGISEGNFEQGFH